MLAKKKFPDYAPVQVEAVDWLEAVHRAPEFCLKSLAR